MLKKREIAPVYLLFGVETRLRNIAADTIAKFALAQPELKEFNQNEVSMYDAPLTDALAAAEQLPFGADKRVVLVRDFFLSTNRQTTSVKSENEERLLNYLENPNETSVVIFLAEEFDKRLKASKMFVQKAVVVDFSPFNDDEAIRFAGIKFTEAGAEANQAAIGKLVDLAGVDAGKLGAEAEKLATAALPDKVVSADLVSQLVTHSRVISNFDLTDSLVAGRKKEALARMQKIFDDGAEPIMILGLLSYNFRQLCMIKDLMSQGLDRSMIRKQVRLGRDADKIFEAARKAPVGKFEKIVKRIAETDVAIKTSKGTPRMQIEMLVCELALG
jgi:DNA polymerase-3 subunit delta